MMMMIIGCGYDLLLVTVIVLLVISVCWYFVILCCVFHKYRQTQTNVLVLGQARLTATAGGHTKSNR